MLETSSIIPEPHNLPLSIFSLALILNSIVFLCVLYSLNPVTCKLFPFKEEYMYKQEIFVFSDNLGQ